MKYQIAGAFIDFLRENYNVSMIVKWYQSNDFEKAFHKKIEIVEKEWYEFLKTIKINDAANERFSKEINDPKNSPLNLKAQIDLEKINEENLMFIPSCRQTPKIQNLV